MTSIWDYIISCCKAINRRTSTPSPSSIFHIDENISMHFQLCFVCGHQNEEDKLLRCPLIHWHRGVDFHRWWLTTLKQIFERLAYQMTMGWICVRATWHTMIRFRQSEHIYIQRQLSPQLRKRGGQLSSSTSIHYVFIKKINGDRQSQQHPNCHTGKPPVVQKCTYCWTIKRLCRIFTL